VADADGAIADLERRLVRYPAERYPVQHATAQFHLGVALTNEGRLGQAEAALTSALRGFEPEALWVERAKVRNALGAMLRLSGRVDEAAAAFEAAAESFEAAGLTADQGAARFNLGLVRRELGDSPAADQAFERACKLLESVRLGAQAGAAVRELGTTRFLAGDIERAVDPLERGVWLADQARDEAGRGGAANILGLVHLTAERPQQAIEAFRTALTAYPRRIRPESYALVKGNLALALEQVEDVPRARLASRQALSIAVAAEPVRAQAAALLERLGDEPGDVLQVLDVEPPERWPATMREELARWVDVDPRERRTEAEAWIEGQLARDAGADLAEAWIDALLELPPQHLVGLVTSLLEALGDRNDEERAQVRSEFSRAMARLHVPQLMRLTEIFSGIAQELGQEEGWT
jgi:tetratricopeptide (TPR) repeat protein